MTNYATATGWIEFLWDSIGLWGLPILLALVVLLPYLLFRKAFGSCVRDCGGPFLDDKGSIEGYILGLSSMDRFRRFDSAETLRILGRSIPGMPPLYEASLMVGPLCDRLENDNDMEVRRHCAFALIDIGNTLREGALEAFPCLKRVAMHKDSELSTLAQEAADAIMAKGPFSPGEAYASRLQHTKERQRADAKQALEEISYRVARPKNLPEDEGPRPTDE